MVNLILDTDMGPDCDDVGALAVAHAFADRGEAALKAVTCCTSSPWAARCADALNSFFGRGDIPVGELKKKGVLDNPAFERFNQAVGALFQEKEYDSAVRVLRRTLAAERDLTLVCIGPLKNMELLLTSGPDDISPLTGPELMAQSLRNVVAMAGAFTDAAIQRRDGEFNFVEVPEGTKLFLEKCPVPILFSGYEIGAESKCGGVLAALPENPVSECYRLYLGETKAHNSFDLTAVYCAVRPPETLWGVRGGVTVHYGEGGVSEYSEGGSHSFLTSAFSVEKVTDTLDGLLKEAIETRV